MNKVVYPDLQNKYVVVTGARRGIGKSIAQAFLRQGAKAILISRNKITWFHSVNKIEPSRDGCAKGEPISPTSF
mgnify:CR=1 FL=1